MGKKREMSEKQKATQFKKGQVANPLGAGAGDPVKRELKRLTTQTVKDIIEIALSSDLGQLEAVIKNPKSTAMQVGIATSLYKAVKNGDFNTLGAIVRTILGDPNKPGPKEITADNVKTVEKILLKIPANGKTKEENK